jgi:phage gpG-like protein
MPVITDSSSFNHWLQVAEAIAPACEAAVEDTATACEQNIQAKITSNGQVRTGYMHSSVYKVTNSGSDYQGGPKALPMVSKASGPTEAVAAVAADYAAINNYGGAHHAGRAFFEPGVSATVPFFSQKVAEINLALAEAAK